VGLAALFLWGIRVIRKCALPLSILLVGAGVGVGLLEYEPLLYAVPAMLALGAVLFLSWSQR